MLTFLISLYSQKWIWIFHSTIGNLHQYNAHLCTIEHEILFLPKKYSKLFLIFESTEKSMNLVHIDQYAPLDELLEYHPKSSVSLPNMH